MKKFALVIALLFVAPAFAGDFCLTLKTWDLNRYIVLTQLLDRNDIEWKLTETRHDQGKIRYRVLVKGDEEEVRKIKQPHFSDTVGLLSGGIVVEGEDDGCHFWDENSNLNSDILDLDNR